MIPTLYFDRFQRDILSLPLKPCSEKYEKPELVRPEFRLFSEGALDVYYAPFHFFEAQARVVLVGLTPGWTQMEGAFRAARQGLSLGLEGAPLFEHIDKAGSFSGPMRRNLVTMLDGIGLSAALGIDSSDSLFRAGSHSASFTSVVTPPIFRGGQNYSGLSRPLLRVRKLRDWIVENLGSELASVPRAIIVPLGRCADEVITFLQSAGVGNLLDRSLTGFPHPSGANGHRKPDFETGRGRWSGQLAHWFGTVAVR